MLDELLKKYEIVIGLEVHAQLNTKEKLMSAARNDFGKGPNTSVSTICTGMPGALPVLNQKAVEMAIECGLALGCHVQKKSIFSRKHYFYPDLPKGYQISQYDLPYAQGGAVEFYFNNEKRKINLQRIHMEEDAGKNLHLDAQGISLVDLNRSSVPLLEIVSEPEIRSPQEAAAYLKALRLVLRYLDICEGNLEEGNFRCDANVSLRLHGAEKFGTRVELKNINSFRNLERAIEYEALRQFQAIEDNQSIVQETRLWDANKNQSISMRSKEEAADYRYMPEPDLLPLVLTEKLLSDAESRLPELPIQKMQRFIKTYSRSAYEAEVLCASKELATYFETVAKGLNDFDLASNFIMTNVLAKISNLEKEMKSFYPDSGALTELLHEIQSGNLSLGMAKEVFETMFAEKKKAKEIIESKGLSQINDEKIIKDCVLEAMKEFPKQLSDFRSGKDKLFGFFMGQCQKSLKGKANPSLLKKILEENLK